VAHARVMNNTERKLVLIGLRGSGKSTLGHALAAAQGYGFVDLDDVTPRVMGFGSVAEAWSARGEAAFRAAEVKALDDVLRGDAKVIALGGGTPTAPGCAERLIEERRAGRVVIAYLRSMPEELRERLRGKMDASRPSLTGKDPLVEIDDVFAARDPLYQRLATRMIENVRSVEDGVKRMGDWVGW